MTFLIRPLQLEQDLYAIHDLTAQLGYPTTLENIQQRWQNIHQDPNYQTLVVEHEQRVIGYAGLIQEYSWEFDEGYLRIQAFVVDEAYRGQGVGKRLIAAIEDLAKQRGLKLIQVNSGNREERLSAHAFYQSLGFDAYSIGFRKYLN
ncbi:GNAT family N-acetyltransferase [Acinetobacter sp. LoGeW2-3]|uniref:GNAT family N-acetyltransferase n=1 Tax=Acinetobacter sp. LoGeW2-3 TaxID=1808001 RepID=UPI000C05A2D0|nr:GNAT family N-acetyltransferase [Acinetobacter sp. LoGeW2-3]ATO19864.1 GNAT family N-acetyltransferase [Acinetobacter sp. LoGeW2-3]